jgi:upstream activation factor subunit UAF30
VSGEERAEYTRVIDEILHASDLETVTRKAIMRGLEEAVNRDLKDQKVSQPQTCSLSRVTHHKR